MGQIIKSHQFENGLTLVCETMGWLESAAVSISAPAGCIHDPNDQLGLANLTCEMMQRGCGPYDSRAFVDQLDRLGADRGSSVTQSHASFAAAALADSLPALLEVFAHLVLRPRLDEDQFEDARSVCEQELASLEDDLPQRMMNHLRRVSYPEPWGRVSGGSCEGLAKTTHANVVAFHRSKFVPQSAILSVAGRIDFNQVKDLVEQLFSEWAGDPISPVKETPMRPVYDHLPHESSQTQIGISYPTIPYRHEDYFLSRGAVGALSDGMSSRLFTEVRENRGLCYSVFASCYSQKDHGRVMGYAGTTTERAQETLDVMLAEIRKLADGITQEELERVKARTKSALIMQQESSSARANALSGDWYHLGRIRTMDELHSIVDALTVDRINAYLRRSPPDDFAVVTLGQSPLEVAVGLS